MQRIPEPELMDEPAQARAYAEADFSEPNQLFAEAVAGQLAGQTPGQLVDLGCGPGDICLRIARALPDWRIVGLDAGPNMLSLAGEAVTAADLAERIELVHARLPEHGLDGRFDAVVSNSLLHHLPDHMSLWRAVADLAAPGAYIQIMDLHRPDSVARARWLVDQHAADAPEILRQDFYNSLLAAWTIEEVRDQYEQAGLASLRLSRPTERHWMASGFLPAAPA
ncbi:class I SAM-dependent methyltransferase [Wenzhouxiangella limi]|uniref:Methyltransferase domain-containing protein n=1 Tax=Wenzhouxiangella limi TaxID=2707351 RepID=A0A845V2E4_9GAMM|nr:class I SAM-dependent methyltransferase [Wenzhouxiangella limi]NDY94451.1 methyltransferase domain-containing protein [Wenzhouxiangella limi]